MKSLLKLSLLLLFIKLTTSINAQVALAPTSIFLDKNSGVGNLFVSNRSDKAQEVSITFAFGYPTSDEEGNLVMNYTDSIAFQQYALDPFIRAFPRTFILAPNKQQTVRLQVKSANKLKDGFYFTRVKVLSTEQSKDVAAKPVEGLSTNIIYKFEQVTAAFYKRGNLKTGVKVDKVDIEQKDGKIIAKPHLDRVGTAPFLGSIAGKILDSNGKVVSELESTTTVYFKTIRRAEFDLPNAKPGNYTLELTFKTKRSDMSKEDLVQADPVVSTTNFTVK
jgi:hypothetical protein